MTMIKLKYAIVDTEHFLIFIIIVMAINPDINASIEFNKPEFYSFYLCTRTLLTIAGIVSETQQKKLDSFIMVQNQKQYPRALSDSLMLMDVTCNRNEAYNFFCL